MQISYDKFCMLNSIELNKIEYKIPVCNTEFEDFIPDSFNDFRSNTNKEEWRTFLYSIFANTLYPKMTYNLIKIKTNKKKLIITLKTRIKKIVNYISKKTFNLFKYKFFFINHGLLYKDFILFNFKLKQLPLKFLIFKRSSSDSLINGVL